MANLKAKAAAMLRGKKAGAKGKAAPFWMKFKKGKKDEVEDEKEEKKEEVKGRFEGMQS